MLDLKSAVLLNIHDQERKFRVATLSEAINLSSLFYQRQRGRLIEELKVVDASKEDVATALAQIISERGLASTLLRAAFDVENAREVLITCCDEESKDFIEHIPMELVVQTALRCLGHKEDAEESGNV